MILFCSFCNTELKFILSGYKIPVCMREECQRKYKDYIYSIAKQIKHKTNGGKTK